MLSIDRGNLLILLIVILVISAGCLGPSPEEDGDGDNRTSGVSITPEDGISPSFFSASESYIEGETVVLKLQMKNTGEATARNIDKDLFGASFLADSSPVFSGGKTLEGVRRSQNRSGESAEVVWRVENDVDLPDGKDKVFPAGVRYRYGYATVASGSFTVVSERGVNDSEKTITTQNTAGPLSVSINLPQTVVAEPGAETLVPVEIKNVGDGKVAGINGEPKYVRIDRAVFKNSDASIDCPQEFRLFDGSRGITCTAEFPSEVFKRYMSFQVRLEYPYFETVETSFTIKGREGSPGD